MSPGAQRTLGDFSRPGKALPHFEHTGRDSSTSSRSGSQPVERWKEEVDAFVRTWQKKRLIGDRWAKGLRYTLGRIPALLATAGSVSSVASSSDLGEQHVAVLRTGMGWERATTQFYFAGLRQFLRWRGNPISEQSEIWRLPPGTSTRRRWLSQTELARLLQAAAGPGRLIVALEGFNGLRRVEILRLRAMDVNLGEGWLNVRGKGRMGGKWRQIPMSELAKAELDGRVRGLHAEDRILPYSASWADQQLRTAARAAGFEQRGVRVSHHDLRRTFGRVAYAAGMDLVQLKNLFGHSSLEMSVHYIGLDLDRMREGLGQIDRTLGPLVRELHGGRKKVAPTRHGTPKSQARAAFNSA